MDYLLDDDALEFRDEMRSFASSIPRQMLLDMDAEKIVFPREFLEEAGRRHLLGPRFSENYGGRSLPWTAEMAGLEEIGVLGTSLACLWSLISIVGEAIEAFGTEEQKEHFLVPMLRGELAAAEGLTEPRGGSDFFGAVTTARRDGDAFVLNGQKRFVVGAEGADVILVYARIEDEPDPKKGMTAFLVERGEGVEVENVYELMGTRGGGTGRLVFRDVRVPLENVLGGEAGLGHGTEVFHRMMVPERLTSAGGAVGMGRACLEIATRYADRRHAFGRKVRQFEGVSFKIAEGLTQLDAARALNHSAAAAIDRGVAAGPARRLVSEAKYFSTEAAWQVVNHSMQILGGIGYTNIYPVERMLRDVRLITIWTGTNEIMKLVIQHEFYREFRDLHFPGRDLEDDASGAGLPGEKIYGGPEEL